MIIIDEELEKLTEELNDNTDILVEYFKMILERLDKITEILNHKLEASR